LDQEGRVIDLTSIDPARGEKFSPNLFRWLKNQKRHGFSLDELVVCRADGDNGALYIGRLERDGWLSGSSLRTVLARGGRASTFACPPGFGFKLVADFWRNYERDGRCAIDPDHRQHFQGDDGRYVVSSDGTERVCTWCGLRQAKARWVKVTRKKCFAWASTPATTGDSA